mgnify:CR=1 FL=1
MGEIELYRATCKDCGGNSMAIEGDPPSLWLPDWNVDITCLECGWSESTQIEHLTLEQVNEVRFGLGLDGIEEFKEKKSNDKNFYKNKKKRKGKRSKRIPLNAHDKKVADRKKKNTL